MSHFKALLIAARVLKKELKSPHRKYHDINHIFYMWKNYKKYKKSVDTTPLEDTAVRLAIWFHDIVYYVDELYHHNETYSADTVEEIIINFGNSFIEINEDAVKILEYMIEMVRVMILNSGDHIHYHPAYRGTYVGLFLDLDLLSLADMPNLFINNANIIAEFGDISKTSGFWKNRAEFLANLLISRYGFFEFYIADINKEHATAAETGIMLLLQHATFTAKMLDNTPE